MRPLPSLFASLLCLLVVTWLPAIATAKVFVLDLDETAPAGQISLKDVPERSLSQVTDEREELTEAQLSKVSSTLSHESSRPVYLLIKEGELPTEESTYANEILRRWGGASYEVSALVFAVDQPFPSVHIAFAGRDLDADERSRLQALGRDMLTRMPSQSSFAASAAVAAIELTSELDTLPLSQQTLSDLAAAASQDTSTTASAGGSPATHWEALSARLNWTFLRTTAAIIGCLLIAIGGFVVLRRLRQSTGLYFPDHLPRKRFSAPFAGGSNAQVRYGE